MSEHTTEDIKQMLELTQEQLNTIPELIKQSGFFELHDTIDKEAQQNENILQIVSHMGHMHGFSTKSAFGNGLTIGITIGLLLAAEAGEKIA